MFRVTPVSSLTWPPPSTRSSVLLPVSSITCPSRPSTWWAPSSRSRRRLRESSRIPLNAHRRRRKKKQRRRQHPHQLKLDDQIARSKETVNSWHDMMWGREESATIGFTSTRHSHSFPHHAHYSFFLIQHHYLIPFMFIYLITHTTTLSSLLTSSSSSLLHVLTTFSSQCRLSANKFYFNESCPFFVFHIIIPFHHS